MVNAFTGSWRGIVITVSKPAFGNALTA